MELTEEDVSNIIKQLGYKKALHWTVKDYSKELLGYLGEHLTLTVNVETKEELKFFVKCIPRFDKWKSNYITELGFFGKEHKMLHSLFVKFGQGTEKWRPTVYLVKENLFVFEDVVQLGYKMPHDQDTLTLAEVRACTATMARFHAQSYIYEEKMSHQLKRPYRIWEDYSNYLQEPNRAMDWRNAGMYAVIDVLKVHSQYKDKPNFKLCVESMIPKLFAKSFSLTKPHSMYRNVVVHRDLWMNNIFFKNDTNGNIHAIFVDFQTVLYCPPMLDLVSFLYFNTKRKFRDDYVNTIIDLYYVTLKKEMNDVNIDIENIIDMECLKKSYKDYIACGIFQAALIIPITLITKEMNDKIFDHPDKSKKFYEVSRSEEILEIVRTDMRYRNHVMELFDEIVERYIYCTI